MALYSTILFG